MRQMTPDASREMAMGRKTIVLNAVFHDTLSESTARTSPTVTTSAGKAATQKKLFTMARRMRRSSNMVR
jgi:tRNA C32,U32 (ribose-2'-O)-methylase TrmJ